MQDALGGHAAALDLGRTCPPADVDRRAQRRVPRLPGRRDPPRADRRRRRRDRVRRDRGRSRARARSRSAPRPRGCSTRGCSARAATAPCCSRTPPTWPRWCRRSSTRRASTSPQLLPAAYTRELRGEPADPEHRHVASRSSRSAAPMRCSSARAPRRSRRRSTRASRRSRRAAVTFDVTFAQTDVSNGAVKAILLAGAPRTAGGEEEELMLRATRAIIERPGPLPRAHRRQHRSRVRGHRRHAHAADVHVLRRCDQHRRAHHGARRRRPAARARGRARTRAHDLRRDADRAVQRPRARRSSSAHRTSAPRSASASRRRSGRSSAARPSSTRCSRALQQRRRRARRPRDRHGRHRARQDPAAGRALRPGRGYAARCACSARTTGASHPYCGRRGAPAARAAARSSHAGAAPSSAASAPSIGERAPGLEPWLPLLGLVVGLDLPATPESAALEERFVSERIAASVEALLERLAPGCGADRRRRRAVDGRGVGGADRPHRRAASAARRWLLVVAHRSDDDGFAAPPRASTAVGAAAGAARRGCGAAARRAADRGRAAPGARRGGDRAALRRQPALRHRDGRAPCARAPTTTPCPSRSRP